MRNQETRQSITDYFNAVKKHILASCSQRTLKKLYQIISELELLKAKYIYLLQNSDNNFFKYVIPILNKFATYREKEGVSLIEHLILIKIEMECLDLLLTYPKSALLIQKEILSWERTLSKIDLLNKFNKTQNIDLILKVVTRFNTIPALFFRTPNELLEPPKISAATPANFYRPTVGQKINALILNSLSSYMRILIPQLLKQTHTPQEFLNKLCLVLSSAGKNWSAVCVLIAARRAERQSKIFTSIFNIMPMILQYVGAPTLACHYSEAVPLIIHFEQHKIPFELEQNYFRIFFYYHNLQAPFYQKIIVSFIQNKTPSEENSLKLEAKVKCLDRFVFYWNYYLWKQTERGVLFSPEEIESHTDILYNYIMLILNSYSSFSHHEAILHYAEALHHADDWKTFFSTRGCDELQIKLKKVSILRFWDFLGTKLIFEVLENAKEEKEEQDSFTSADFWNTKNQIIQQVFSFLQPPLLETKEDRNTFLMTKDIYNNLTF